jgi:N-acetylmuramoyl-L-alanine amidase
VLRLLRSLLAVLLLSLTGQCLAGETVEFKNVRLWAAPDNTRVVFDVSGPHSYKLFSLQNPERIVVDVPAGRVANTLKAEKVSGGLVKGVRVARNKPDTLRIVFDLQQRTRPRSFSLKPNGQYGHRLVVDFYETGNTEVPVSEAPPKSAASQPAISRTTRTTKAAPTSTRDLVIAIDAGHGGDDPGAIGRRGTREKDVVLAIARHLADLVEKEPGMRPVMIREGDYYVGLRQRINKARKYKADLFISIHADGFKDHRAHGSSVYVLSNRGASSEMGRWLEAKENAADLAGGVSLDDKDDVLAEVLLDLSQSATMEASFEVADNMLGELKRLGKTHKSTVQQAAFVVLKSPDIPSMLVETAFISNPAEENKLRDKRHQQSLANAMLKGIRDYFGSHPPPGTLMVAQQHVVKSGDTLSDIAQRYQVSLSSLRGYNSLKNDTLKVGDKLRIPPSRGS